MTATITTMPRGPENPREALHRILAARCAFGSATDDVLADLIDAGYMLVSIEKAEKDFYASL